MQKRNIASVGIWLPSYAVCITALLILVSLASSAVSSVIFADKLILLVIGLSPVAFVSGAAVCAVALIKRRNRATAFAGIVLNIVLLAALLYFFARPFIVELTLLS